LLSMLFFIFLFSLFSPHKLDSCMTFDILYCTVMGLTLTHYIQYFCSSFR
jgi:hypothetical protein